MSWDADAGFFGIKASRVCVYVCVYVMQLALRVSVSWDADAGFFGFKASRVCV